MGRMKGILPCENCGALAVIPANHIQTILNLVKGMKMNKAQKGKESGQTALRLFATKPLFCNVCGEASHIAVDGGLLYCNICNSKTLSPNPLMKGSHNATKAYKQTSPSSSPPPSCGHSDINPGVPASPPHDTYQKEACEIATWLRGDQIDPRTFKLSDQVSSSSWLKASGSADMYRSGMKSPLSGSSKTTFCRNNGTPELLPVDNLFLLVVLGLFP